jgi:hypothetical protein
MPTSFGQAFLRTSSIDTSTGVREYLIYKFQGEFSQDLKVTMIKMTHFTIEQ